MPFDGTKELNADQLRVAAAQDVLRRDGWVRGSFAHPGGGHCIFGAFGIRTWDDILLLEKTQIGRALRAEVGSSRLYGVVRYNDSACGSLDTALAFLERVKARL